MKLRLRLGIAKGLEAGSALLPRVDRAKGLIRGASALQAVEALGHGMACDQTTVDQVVAFGNGLGARGLLMRYGHPGLCADALAARVGHAFNFRRVGAGEGPQCKAVCDAQLGDFAKSSPMGDLWTNILDHAESAPQDFGLSIGIEDGYAAWKLSDGTEIDSHDASLREGDGEDAYYVRPENAVGPLPYARIRKLKAVDFVDDPAANRDGLFSSASLSLADVLTAEPGSERSLAAFAFIDEQLSLASIAPERALGFMQRYAVARGVKLSTLRPAPPLPKEHPMDLAALLAKYSGFEKEVAVAFAAKGATEASVADAVFAARLAKLEGEKTQLGTRITELETALAAKTTKVTELETQLAALKPKGGGADAGKTGGKGQGEVNGSEHGGGDGAADPETLAAAQGVLLSEGSKLKGADLVRACYRRWPELSKGRVQNVKMPE